MVVGGADYFNLDLIKRLDKDKYESIVLTTTPSNNPLRQEFETYASEIYDMSTFLERTAYINFTDYIISSRNVDMVVISNTTYGYYMVPYLKGKYPTIPFIDYIHSIDLADPRESFGRCTMDVDKYLTKTYCCNNFTKKQLEEKYNKKNVETLYIGTDDKKFNPEKYNKEELLEKYNLPKDKKIISFIARLSDEKRPKMFIKIAKKLLEKRNDIFFVIAGDGPLMGKVASRVNDNFKLLGMVKESEEVYAISDITVNCSSLEGLALTSYESLAMGVPVVSTDVGGQTELIDETVGGIVHYNANPEKETYYKEIDQYVEKIDRVLNNLEEISNNCRKKIIDESIEKEKNTKVEKTDYLSYELSCECFHKIYYFYCKNYIENKFDIYYDKDHIRKKGKWSKRRKKINSFLLRHQAKHEAVVILDFLRAVKRMLKEFIIMIKFFIKSIPAIFKLLYKIIFK
jgi:glycosyltransferase involved in cell wall biosynthesis